MAKRNKSEKNNTANLFDTLFMVFLILGIVLGGLVAFGGFSLIGHGGESLITTGITIFVAFAMSSVFMKAIAEIIQLLEDIKNRLPKQ